MVASTTYGASDYLSAIEASGFPGIGRQPARLRRGLLDAYLQGVVDRDLPEHGLSVRRPDTLRRWLQAFAAASSTTRWTPSSRVPTVVSWESR